MNNNSNIQVEEIGRGAENGNMQVPEAPRPTIEFISVQDNAAKLKAICDIAASLFFAERRLIIRVPNMQAATYVNALLWKLPEEGFLPHAIAESPTAEPCVISTAPGNWNGAKALLNLCPEIPSDYCEYEAIFELWDETDPTKRELSAKRKLSYQQT